MFKKCSFYTLIRICGKVQAVKVFGYTDGKYMYYNTNSLANIGIKARGKNGWFCVHPEIGLSFPGPRNSRKMLHSFVYTDEMQEKCTEYMHHHGEWAKRKYAEYIEQAEKGMVWNNETA